jgi:predicted DNA-binding transcriptional regulator AlpA
MPATRGAQVKPPYTKRQVGRLIGRSERSIDRLREAKAIPGEMDLGRGVVRFDRQAIDMWVARRRKRIAV